MLKISKNTNKIVSIRIGSNTEEPENHKLPEIDSFIIIPGVTIYNHIYSKVNWLIFHGRDSYIYVEFLSETDLERFFNQLMRDIKLNQIINVSVEKKETK